MSHIKDVLLDEGKLNQLVRGELVEIAPAKKDHHIVINKDAGYSYFRNTGIYPTLSNDDYHSDPAISRSGIMEFIDSPFKYWANYLNPDRPKKESTQAMEFGTAFHAYVLERSWFNANYIVKPEKVLLKDVGEPLYREYKNRCDYIDANKHLVSLTNEEFQLINKMYNALLENEEAWALIEEAIYEQSYFWEDEHTGVMCKCRPDILHSNMVVDLKTCRSADSRSYQREMIDSGYHVQAAMIREGIKQTTGKEINNFINICIEKTYPYAIGIKIIGEDALEKGHMLFKQALLDLRNCIEKNEYLGYDIETVNLPTWAQ